MDGINIQIIIFVSFTLLSMVIENMKDIYMLVKIVMLGIFTCFLNMLANLQWDKLFSVRLGLDNINRNWNANDLGEKFAYFILLSLVLKKEHQLKHKSLIVFIDVIFLFFSVLTGSRKTIIMLILFPIIYIAFEKRGKVLKSIYLSIFSIFILYSLMMTIPALYNIIGYRFEGIVTGSSTEGSYIGRLQMISMGFNWFSIKPIFGYGLNNFRAMSIFNTYSHSNYIELLVNLGMIGFLLYYYIYFLLIRKSCHLKKYKNFILACIISGLVIDAASVTYTNYLWAIILFLCMSIIDLQYRGAKI